MFSDIVSTSLPVLMLKIRMILSFNRTAKNFPRGLRDIDRGGELAWRSWRNWVCVLYLYDKWVGKSKVFGFQTSIKDLSSIDMQTLRSQFILMNLMGCLWKEIVLTMWQPPYYFLSSVYISPWGPFTAITSSYYSLLWADSDASVSIIQILPVFSSLTATKYSSFPSWGIN